MYPIIHRFSFLFFIFWTGAAYAQGATVAPTLEAAHNACIDPANQAAPERIPAGVGHQGQILYRLRTPASPQYKIAGCEQIEAKWLSLLKTPQPSPLSESARAACDAQSVANGNNDSAASIAAGVGCIW